MAVKKTISSEKKSANPNGRPREHDRDQIALDLIEWAKKEDSINVNKFCAMYNPPFACKKLSEWSHEDPRFRESYDIAKTFLAFRREEWVSTDMLHVKAYDLTAAAYDHVVKEERMLQSTFESNLRKEQEKSAPNVIVKVSHDGLGSGINISAEGISNPNNNGFK